MPAVREEVRQHHELAKLAERQHGVVSRAQLVELGYSNGAIARGVRSGRLHRIYRGAFGVGHRNAGPRGLCLAGVFSCGAGALVSHMSAAWLWRLADRPSLPPDITCPTRGHRRPGPRIHHSTILEDADLGRIDGIPLTSVARTLLDVAGNRQPPPLNDAIERAERRELLDLGEVDAVLARAGGHPGREPLRTATEIYRAPAYSRARSERLFLAAIKDAGLPSPVLNSWVEKWEVDAYWEAERFAVEVDGWEAHGTRKAFEDDHLRWEEMKVAGIEVIPMSARRIERHPGQVGAHLRTLLGRRRRELRHP